MRQLFFFWLLIGHFAQAQTSNWELRGTITDEYGTPLPGASILTDDITRAVTDATGEFVAPSPTRPKVLAVRRLGFVNYRLKLDTLQWRNQKAYLNITLNTDNPQLQEVVISSSPIQAIFKEDFSHELLDYAFAGPNLLLLVKEKKKYFLRYTTDEAAVLSEMRLPSDVQPTRIHTSCTGAHHVVGRTAVWEVGIAKDNVDTFPRYEPIKFYQLVEPCQVAIDDHYFYRRMGNFNQSAHFYYFGPDRRRRHLLTVMDTVAEQNAWATFGRFVTGSPYFLTRPVDLGGGGFARMGGGTGLDPEEIAAEAKSLSISELIKILNPESNDQLYSFGALQNQILDSVYAPMLLIHEQLYVLDHSNNYLVHISGAEMQLNRLPLSYHLQKGWQKDVLHDVANGKVYGVFYHAIQGYSLAEIDFKTGKSRSNLMVKGIPFLSERFKVRNGRLYVIGQPDINIPNKFLYRIVLSKL
jgi:CarboxypepD_reg-like domain